MYHEDRVQTHWAVDSDSGKLLTEKQARIADDNPLIWTWVRWFAKSDFPTIADVQNALAAPADVLKAVTA